MGSQSLQREALLCIFEFQMIQQPTTRSVFFNLRSFDSSGCYKQKSNKIILFGRLLRYCSPLILMINRIATNCYFYIGITKHSMG
jgi:hypothetical protein